MLVKSETDPNETTQGNSKPKNPPKKIYSSSPAPVPNFRRRDDSVGGHDAVRVLFTDLGDQQGPHTSDVQGQSSGPELQVHISYASFHVTHDASFAHLLHIFYTSLLVYRISCNDKR